MSRHPDLDRAADFIAKNARLLERLRFQQVTTATGADQVAAAVRAYQNPDGGFGQGLEPDLRTASSQPAAARAALEALHEVDRLGDVGPLCDHLASISVDGGLPFATAEAARAPHPPWFAVAADAPPSPVFTAPIAGILAAHGVGHPWVAAAVAYSKRAVARFDPPAFTGATWEVPRIGASYEARALVHFCGHVGDRGGAERIGRIVLERGLVELDASAGGEAHTPLDHAPLPTSPLRRLFTDDVIEAHLDALVRAQADDGGWPVPWAKWNPTTTTEWRGILTVEAVKTLTAYAQVTR
jgi:hypothetical protein